MLVVVASDAQFESLRLIRNSCREFMTRDTAEISPEAQAAWRSSMPLSVSAYLLVGEQSRAIGYGLVRDQESSGGFAASWLSGGLLPDYRGAGLGSSLFCMLCAVARHTPWLEVLSSNARAVRLYRKLGFVEQFSSGPVITMKLMVP